MRNGDTSLAELVQLRETVIDGGYCIGCGACAAAAPDAIRMAMDDAGRWQAEILSNETVSQLPLTAICPFGQNTRDEDQLAREFLDTAAMSYDSAMGHFTDIWAGYAPDEYRDLGSSGGLATWFAGRLLDQGVVDAVAHVFPSGDGAEEMFRYGLSRTSDEVKRGGKSHYHTVEMSQVIEEMQATEGRFLVVGVPCFIKAVRNVTRFNPDLRARIVYTAAIFCGHMKSTAYGQLLGWQMGVEPDELAHISFREKLLDRPANRYGTKATDVAGRTSIRPAAELHGTDWGLGYFKFKACDFCDDISGETADIAFGDAWLPQYEADSRGTSLVVVRNKDLSELLGGAAELHLERLTGAAATQSQDANFRHRREGLAHRLAEARRVDEWTPPKRVEARVGHLTAKERRRVEIRTQLSAESHDAFQEARHRDDLAAFHEQMAPLVAEYRRLTARSVVNAGMKRVRRIIFGRRRDRGYLRPMRPDGSRT